MCVGSLGLRQQQLEITLGAHGIAEQEALYIGAVESLQETELLFRLDALGNDIHLEATSHVNDSADDRCIVGVHGDIANERLVDLQSADRKLLQRAQRRITGPEVVDSEMQAERIEFVEQPDGPPWILHQRGLGYLELERRGRNLVLAEDGVDAADEIGLP